MKFDKRLANNLWNIGLILFIIVGFTGLIGIIMVILYPNLNADLFSFIYYVGFSLLKIIIGIIAIIEIQSKKIFKLILSK